MAKKKIAAALIWVAAPISECLSSGKPIQVREAELTVLGPEDIMYALDLGYCPESGHWYALLEDLEDILSDEGWRFTDVRGVEVDGEPVEAQIFLMDRLVPWASFQETIRQIKHEAEQPPPSDEAVRSLPELPETWEAGVRAAAWVGGEDEAPQVGYLTVVVDAQGLIRSSDVTAGAPPDASAMAGFVRRAAGAPGSGLQPGRPQQVRVAGEARAQALGEALAAAGIPVAAAPTRLADEALADATAHLLRSGVEPYLTGYEEAELRAFFRAARAFYRAQPWERFDGDRYLGFRIDNGAWYYASVMGQMEAEPGLSLFESWHQLCRLVHNQPSLWDLLMDEDVPAGVAAAGGIEGMTLAPLEVLHPEDGAYLLRLGLAPLGEDRYPLPQRFTEDDQEPLHFPLSTYRRLMEALLTILNRRSTPVLTSIKQTVQVDDVEVDLRYPADGLESIRMGDTSPPGYRLVVEGREPEDLPRAPVPPGTRLVIDAPGDAKVYDIARTLRREIEGLWVRGLGTGRTYLWSDAYPRKEPSPSVAGLEDLDDLWIEFVTEVYPVRLLPRVGETGMEIRVRVER